MWNTRYFSCACTFVAALASCSSALVCGAFDEASAQSGGQTFDQRKSAYAPWSPAQMAERRKEYGLIGPGTTKSVPPPAFPSYLKKPDSIEQLMPQARAAVRQTGGRTPLGLVEPGKHLLIVVGEVRDFKPNMMVQAAIKRALEERGVKCTIITTWETLGMTEEEFMEFRVAMRTYRIGDGQRELESYFTTTGFMPNAQKGRDWVASKDPELAKATWPVPKLSSERFEKLAADYFDATPRALNAWLDKHPEIDWIVWRSGNRPNSRKMLAQHGEKFLGNYTYLDLYDLMSQVPSFPSDVWRLVETKTMEPLAFVDRAEVTDPEGTAFGYDVDEEMAKTWAAGVYNQGHLYMYPAQASGRFPYSIIEYPTMGGAYLTPVQPETTGIIASTSSHAATHPRMEILIEKGRVKEVRGGGLYGEGIRLMMTYPGTNENTWPFQKQKGYWWLYEAGLGTNPKYFKHPAEVIEGNNLSERNVAGVIHWALGSEVSMGPGKVGAWAKESEDFTSKPDLPLPKGHSMHQHNHLPTVQVRIRDLDQWVTLIEHGGLTALNDVYVRALASRYGNPNDILRRDYVSALPGINAPGDYTTYASNPGAYWTSWAESIEAGKYEFFRP